MSSLVENQDLKGVLSADFAHGYASASYQIEGECEEFRSSNCLTQSLSRSIQSGGHNEGGRGPSVWDEALKDQENGDDAVNSYHLWEQDIELLKQYGSNSYRFSISWSRVKPLGTSASLRSSAR